MPPQGHQRRESLGRMFGVSAKYVQQARALVEHDQIAAKGVKGGEVPLAQAYSELRERERDAEGLTTKIEGLRQIRPDLAEAVEAERADP